MMDRAFDNVSTHPDLEKLDFAFTQYAGYAVESMLDNPNNFPMFCLLQRAYDQDNSLRNLSSKMPLVEKIESQIIDRTNESDATMFALV